MRIILPIYYYYILSFATSHPRQYLLKCLHLQQLLQNKQQNLEAFDAEQEASALAEEEMNEDLDEEDEELEDDYDEEDDEEGLYGDTPPLEAFLIKLIGEQNTTDSDAC